MAGHNKWSKIKRKKGAADAKRSKMYSKLIKEITVAVKEGNSGDEEFNPRLRLAIANAKGINMPKDNIERAIKKALEKDSGAIYQPTYEGYGPGGVAIFVETATDNLNRTVGSIRAIFSKKNGNLATSGSVDFLFERKGIFVLDVSPDQKDDIELALIDGGAEEMEYDSDTSEMVVTVAFEDFGTMQETLESLEIDPKSANLERIPNVYTKLSVDDAKKVLDLIEALEDDDDVQQVFHNLEMTEELEAVLEE
ncbi:YebC/PmpR family DNA-binding transcriptional regulator [Membranicola marinus]|uniref:Probable transcriptional regulatory protein KUV50_02635 n=1 Tax=Membranihabitans marinus TaxID=1227546 RepID=A0A953L7V3_9BACT|nr:YebC/PmpR family DNA-binding transcriptional regulator [Membranihabitans marinus]MBY5957015.1 YebC/PmpR family DNA-binding transcriptional regulator [Membranihabitans marinus]